MPPSFIAPIPNVLVTSGWLDERAYRDGWHAGLDFRAPVGTPVRAVASGTVFTAKTVDNSEAGKWIGINHADGYTSRYLHLSELFVKVGDKVTQGQVIGKSGDTGIARSKPHLHYDMAVKSLAAYPYPRPEPAKYPQTSWGFPVPAEPLIPANFSDAVKARAKALGIPLASGMGTALLLLAGAGIIGYFIYRRFR